MKTELRKRKPYDKKGISPFSNLAYMVVLEIKRQRT